MEKRPQVRADEVYLTPQQVSDRYGGAVSVRTLARMRFRNAKVKGPPFVKVGLMILYPVSWLVIWEGENLRGNNLLPTGGPV